MKISYLTFSSLILISSIIYSQKYEVKLNKHVRVNSNQMHIEVLSDSSEEQLIIPQLISNKLKYFKLFYSYETKNDQTLSIAVDQSEECEKLYIDKNNDEDLTNDGPSIDFPKNQNRLVLEFQPEDDPNQILRLLLYRTPELHDSIKYHYIDSLGNMREKSADFWSMMLSKPKFKGKKGSFYFDDRLTMRKGLLRIDNITYNVGLFDYSNNGLYDDHDDILFIDYNNNRIMNYHEKDEIFSVHDTIDINGNSYRLSSIDKYGESIVFDKTIAKNSKYFLSNEPTSDIELKKLNQSVWSYNYLDLDSSRYDLSELKESYILLNFWGEWCKPCLNEIDLLAKINEEWKGKLKIVSLLHSYNLQKALETIDKKNMEWIHLLSSEDIEKRFKIFGFPTNILIDPSGMSYKSTGVITKEFIEKYLK